jgi:hypothetical protein
MTMRIEDSLAEHTRLIHLLKVRNSRLQAVVGVMVTALLGVALMSALGPPPEEITAKKITIVDQDGNRAATWATADANGEAYITFYAREAGMRLSLNGGENPSLLLNGGGNLMKDGRLGHAKIGVSAIQGPHVSLWGQNVDQHSTDESSIRSTKLMTPWGDEARCLALEVANGVEYSVP